MAVDAYVALGANLGDRLASLDAAVAALGVLPDTEVLAVSPWIETDPVGYLDQPRFLNGVAKMRTILEPRALLEALLAIELGLGRTREGARFGPRTIDLDLLVYGDAELDEPGLTVPHPRLHERRFVLEPLAAIAPDLDVPGRGRVTDLLAQLH